MGAQDFLNVFMHEVGHGLGFQNFINRTTGGGAGVQGFPDMYTAHMRDNTQGLQWNVMTPAQRLTSRTNDGNLVWTGANANANARSALGAYPNIKLRTGDLAGTSFEHNGAQFGGLPSDDSIGTWVVLADDGVAAPGGGTTSDGCEPYTGVTGATVVVDRGLCAFVVKAQVAQAAGAKALIILNNQAGQLSPGGGDRTITIPVMGMKQADGALLKTGLPALAEICDDPIRTLGSDEQGRPRLYAPPVFAGG